MSRPQNICAKPYTCHGSLRSGHADFCSRKCPCGEGEGDCDSHQECAVGLQCGENNAQQFNSALAATIDVCYKAEGLNLTNQGGTGRACATAKGLSLDSTSFRMRMNSRKARMPPNSGESTQLATILKIVPQ